MDYQVSADGGEDAEGKLLAVARHGEVGVQTYFENRLSRVLLQPRERFFWFSKAPNVATLGFVAFPDTFPYIDQSAQKIERLSIPDDNLTAVIPSAGMSLVSWRTFRDSVAWHETVWRFSTVELVPTSRRTYRFAKDDGKRYLSEVEEYEWELRGGVMLPNMIRLESKQKHRDEATGVIFPYTDTYTSHLTWEQVNETIEDSRLNIHQLANPQSLRDWIERPNVDDDRQPK